MKFGTACMVGKPIPAIEVTTRQIEELCTTNAEHNEIGWLLSEDTITIETRMRRFAIVNLNQSP
jgi:hypothetical protein